LQRVAQARVDVGERSIGQIGAGLLILLGVGKTITKLTPTRSPTRLRICASSKTNKAK
jgi:D-Tyr-tRNAtyr deacylase